MPGLFDAAIDNLRNSSTVSDAKTLAAALRTMADTVDQMRMVKARDATNVSTQLDESIRDRIRDYLALRSRAKAMLGGSLLFDPAWDILLVMYVDHADGRQTDITALIASTDTPQATTTRWTHELVKQELITRNADPNDRRRVIVELTARAIEVIETVWLPRAALPHLPTY